MRYFVYVIQDTSVEESTIYQIEDHIIQLNYKPIYIGRDCGDRHLNHVNESHNSKVKDFIKKNPGKFLIEKVAIDLTWTDSVLIEQKLIYDICRENLNKEALFNNSVGVHWNEDQVLSKITPLNLKLNKVKLILKRLNTMNSKKTAAESLGISERTLYRLMHNYNIKATKIGRKKYEYYQI